LLRRSAPRNDRCGRTIPLTTKALWRRSDADDGENASRIGNAGSGSCIAVRIGNAGSGACIVVMNDNVTFK